MTAITLHGPERASARISAFAQFLADIFAGAGEGLAAGHRYEELARLSDAELARRGLRREEIARTVLNGRLPHAV